MRAVGYALALALGLAGVAHAQVAEVNLDRGPTSELYLRKRPPVPEAPVLAPELQKLLASTTKQRDDRRIEAIGLLREFLAGNPEGDARADGLFKLAELLWEEARRTYLVAMDGYERDLERCKLDPASCPSEPTEPRIDLTESAATYQQILDDHPAFRRTDLVLYLVGFAAKEAGREDFAMARFQEVIERFPQSPLYGDAWMMVGEHHFAAGALGSRRARPTRTSSPTRTTPPTTWRCSRPRGATGSSASPTWPPSASRRSSISRSRPIAPAPRRRSAAAPGCATRPSSTW
jgi:tetratricopeptide (TPR) repeat protein